MKRVKLIVAYDGTAYHGWQVQDNGNTIEAELNKALHTLTGEDIKVSGASRTDAGVHALGNIAVFDTNSPVPGDKFSFALNKVLPADIRVQESAEVAADYHPRFIETRKTYQYTILNRRFELPTKRHYATFAHYNLDVDRMQQAADFLVGEHDFASFCSAGAQVQTTVRTIYKCTVTRVDDEVKISITGNGFLYNMVRIIAGTLMQIGSGLMEPSHMAEIIEAKNRNEAGPTAPAKGLMLVKIQEV